MTENIHIFGCTEIEKIFFIDIIFKKELVMFILDLRYLYVVTSKNCVTDLIISNVGIVIILKSNSHYN